MKDTTYVLTPEKVVVSYRISGLNSRIGAQFIDLIFVVALLIGISIIGSMMALISPEIAVGFQLIVGVAAMYVYFILCEALMNGQTLGKKVMRLRVVMEDGTPITPYAAIFRNLLRPADMLPLLPFVGLLSMFLTPKFQRIGDLAVGTIVIHEPAMNMQFSPAPYKYGVHPFEQHIGNLRGMTMNDYIVMKRLCDRFPYLTSATQEKMVKEIWEPFAKSQRIEKVPNVHPIYLMEAVVMKYGRQQELV